MCGINGILAYGPSAAVPSERECRSVRDAMTARGPDGEGMYRDPDDRVLFGHRRLQIIDLSESGAQPMALAEGDLAITYNGEIYNYRQLRRELADDGVRFVGTSDTEVLLHLYRREGEAMVERLEGMFALALWDRRDGSLFLARDAHGIKPLYYAADGELFRFASSVRSLVAGGGVSRQADPRSILAFLAWGSVPEPRSLFRAVRMLPAGSTLRVTPDGVGEPRTYWTPAAAYAARAPVPDRLELESRCREALLESVGRHLVADVPVGLFLSAGVDSGALLGLASELSSEPIRTVTLAFEEFRGRPEDEAPLAEQVARHYSAQHTTVTLSAREVRDGLEDFTAAMDQPTIDGLNVYWVSRAVRQAGLKAALSGLGGDELWGGYSSFQRFPRLRRIARVPGLPRVLGWAASAGPARRRAKTRYLSSALRSPAGTYHLIRGLFTPAEIGRLVRSDVWRGVDLAELTAAPAEAAWQPAPSSDWARAAVAEQSVYMRQQLLRDADWASMCHSLEIRVPLVDRRLSSTLGPLLAAAGGRDGKAPLAASPRPALQPEILRRPKTGFGLPLQAWVAEDCRAGQRPRLPSWLVDAGGQAFVERLADGTVSGRVHWSRVWALRILENLLRETA